MAGLAAAWELSSGDWRERLDSITVYQRGWRLGGKGASSRGPHGRIEEHGLHLLLGCYDATFRVLRRGLRRARPAGHRSGLPLPDLAGRAASRRRTSASPSTTGGAGRSFVTRFSGNAALPGEPGAEDRRSPRWTSPRAGCGCSPTSTAAWPRAAAGRVFLSTSPTPAPAPSDLGTLLRAPASPPWPALLEALERGVAAGRRRPPRDPASRPWPRAARLARRAARRRVGRPRAAADLAAGRPGGHQPARAWRPTGCWTARGSTASTTSTTATGSPGTAPPARRSTPPIVRGMHDLTFAYEGGDRARPRFAAGLGLQLSGRMLFDFKGAIFWRMQAGMGEVVFAPLYEALRRRGVEFRFFSRLTSLGLAGRTLGGVDHPRPAGRPGPRPRAGTSRWSGSAGCPAGPTVRWPTSSRPTRATDLESHGAPARTPGRSSSSPARTSTSRCWPSRVGMVPHVAGELLHAAPAWRDMVDGVGTVATRSAQLWLDACESELGWTGGPGVTLTRLRRHLRHLGLDGRTCCRARSGPPPGAPRPASPTSAARWPTSTRRPGQDVVRAPCGASSTTR